MWSDTKFENKTGLGSCVGCHRDLTRHLETQSFFESSFLAGWNHHSTKIKFPCNFLHRKYQKVKKKWVRHGHLGPMPSGKWKSTNFTKCIKYKVNFHLCGMPSRSDTKFGNTKVLWAMIFVLAEIIIQQKFKNQVSMQLFDIFCIESIKKSKKIGCGMDT